mgnify:CR=1 FL=1
MGDTYPPCFDKTGKKGSFIVTFLNRKNQHSIVIYHTDDGGDSWSVSSLLEASIFQEESASWLSSVQVYVADSINGAVHYTRDAGKNWISVIPDPVLENPRISSVSGKSWAVSNEKLWYSTDQGKHWYQ